MIIVDNLYNSKIEVLDSLCSILIKKYNNAKIGVFNNPNFLLLHYIPFIAVVRP